MVAKGANLGVLATSPLPKSTGGPLENLLEWVDYVHKHFGPIKEYLLATDTFWGRDELLDLIEKGSSGKGSVIRNLATLKAKYSSLAVARSFLSSTVEDLEEGTLRLDKAVEAVESFRIKLSKWPGEFEQRLSEKLDELLSVNSGYAALLDLLHCLNFGDDEDCCESKDGDEGVECVEDFLDEKVSGGEGLRLNVLY